MKLHTSNQKKLFSIITFFLVLLMILTYFEPLNNTLQSMIRLCVPFIVGSCMAFIINLPVRFLEQHVFSRIHSKALKRMQRPLSITLSLLFILGILAIVCFLIIPEFIDKVTLLINTSSTFIEHAGNDLNNLAKDHPEFNQWISTINPNWSELSKEVTNYIRDFFNTIFASTFTIISSVLNGMMNFMISFMFALYLISHKEQFSNQGKQVLYAFFTATWAKKIHDLLTLTNTTFSHFITGQCTEAVIQFLLFFSLLTLLRYPYALLISIFIGFMSLIPIIGSYISSYTSAFLILMTDPWKALFFLLLFMVIQQFDTTFIYPKVVGNSVGLPPILVIVAVTMGGRLFGIFGMLTFIPLFSIMYSLLRSSVRRRLAEKKIEPSSL